MKLTKRQIEVLTEIFDGVRPTLNCRGWAGRDRVLHTLTSYNDLGYINRRDNAVTAKGLRALTPHYPDKTKIAVALVDREKFEQDREQYLINERADRAAADAARQIERRAKLIKGVRLILAENCVPAIGISDDVIVLIARRITSFESSL